MIKRIRRYRALLLISWLAFVALACNLAASNQPPTIVPRSTPTPPPTLGFATLSPAELPSVATAAPVSGAELANLVNQVDTDRLFLTVDRLQSFGTRHVNSQNQGARGITAAYNYLMSELENIRAQSQGNLFMFTQEFPLTWAGQGTIQRNIIAVLTGTEVGAGTIVVTSHYDSISEFPEDASAYAPGANDDGSGLAAILEMARIMAPRQHRATIMFVLFSAEEVGRVGSRSFVDDYVRAQNVDVRAMLNLDIIGSQTGSSGAVNDRQIRVFSAGPNESVQRQLARELNLLAFNLYPNMEVVVIDALDREGRYGDHFSFTDAGYPAVRFTEAAEEEGRTNNSRDTIDDVQASYLRRSTQLALSLVTAMADGPQPPRNITLRDEGGGIRTLVWEPVPGASSYVVALRRPGSLYYDQQFETADNVVRWDGFVPGRFGGVSIAARDATGLMGSLSPEHLITN